jgi:hypothetical protein
LYNNQRGGLAGEAFLGAFFSSSEEIKSSQQVLLVGYAFESLDH